MKREIEFRGRGKKYNSWRTGNFIFMTDETGDGDGYYIFDGDYEEMSEGEVCSEYTEIIPETLGQYTGLNDKHGTKIFEGDLAIDSNDDTYEILFVNGGFYAQLDGNVLIELAEVNEDLEITGDIHTI